ncbi:hypothetical protein [Nocardia sp. NPDC005366]|uniref:hypothetical protein n=1 Tax=Nocardia sp. NPDC005366 TaxID=3156878 RepID=UPI0033BEEA57
MTVAAISELLRGSSWRWPLVVVGALVAGVVVWLAVAVEVGITWMTKHLNAYESIVDRVDRGPFDSNTPMGEISAALTTANQACRAIERPRPPFMTAYGQAMAKTAVFLRLVASERARSGDHERALSLSEAASVAGRNASEGIFGESFLDEYCRCLSFQALCLTEADRLDEAVTIGAKEIDSARELDADRLGPRNTASLVFALKHQAQRLERLGRKTEAEQLAAEARVLDTDL